jgi:mutator protein MutT
VQIPPKVVTAAVLFQQGRLLICRRPPGDHLAGQWELPGGKVEPAETNEDCLARELKEELSIDAVIGPHVATSEYTYERGTILLVAYRVLAFSGAMVATFHSDTRLVGLDEIDRFSFAPADVPLIATIKREWSRYANT